MGIFPGFAFLADEFSEPVFQTYTLDKVDNVLQFADGIRVPLRPFAGVMGAAPDTDEMLDTIPPRTNGGNMDDPHVLAGTTVYFPVFVPGGLLSIGDTHGAQGIGEVSGSAIETPIRIVYSIRVIKGDRLIDEPRYETDAYYATTIDEAARKAMRLMIDYLIHTRGPRHSDAYMPCSLAGDLNIAETVDIPHMLVTMHMPNDIFVTP